MSLYYLLPAHLSITFLDIKLIIACFTITIKISYLLLTVCLVFVLVNLIHPKYIYYHLRYIYMYVCIFDNPSVWPFLKASKELI